MRRRAKYKNAGVAGDPVPIIYMPFDAYTNEVFTGLEPTSQGFSQPRIDQAAADVQVGTGSLFCGAAFQSTTGLYYDGLAKNNGQFTNGTTDEPFTLMCWRKTDRSDLQVAFFSKNNTGAEREYRFGNNRSSTGSTTNNQGYEFQIFDETNGGDILFQTNFGTDNPSDEWAHVALVYYGNQTCDFYKNGVLLNQVVPVTTGTYVRMDQTPSYLCIGRGAQNVSSFGVYNGNMDEVAVYDVALNATQILDAYNKGVAGTPLVDFDQNRQLVYYYTWEGSTNNLTLPFAGDNRADFPDYKLTNNAGVFNFPNVNTTDVQVESQSWEGSNGTNQRAQYNFINNNLNIHNVFRYSREMTIGGWLLYEDNTGTQANIWQGLGSASSSRIYQMSEAGGSNIVTFTLWQNSSTRWSTRAENIPYGTWFHYCAVVNLDYGNWPVRFYINNVLRNDVEELGGSPTYPQTSPTTRIWVGGNGFTGTNNMTGHLDDPFKFNYAISDEERNHIYNEGLAGRNFLPLPQPTFNIYDQTVGTYSFRLLANDYTGSCIRVRRSNDDAEQDIGFSAGVLDQTALTTFVGANDGFVVKWYDQSILRRDASQVNNAQQPQIVTAGVVNTLNGEPCMNLDGTDDVLLADDLAIPANFMVIMVGSHTNGFGYFTHLDTTNDGIEKLGFGTSLRFSYMGDDDTVNKTAGAQLLTIFAYDSTDKIYSINAPETVEAYTAGATSSVTQVALGTRLGGDHAECQYQEVIYWNTQAEIANRATIKTDINTYYNVY